MIHGVILAAGTSSRMGSPKQLLPLRGKPLLQHAIDVAAASDLPEVILVLGSAASEIRAQVRLPANVRVVLNPAYASGQASSLREGISAVGAEAEAVVVLLGDQPGLSPASIRRAVDAYRRTGGPVVRAIYGDQPGHPVVLGRQVWARIAEMGGDAGAREFLAQHPESVVTLPLEGEAPPEVNTPEDYRRLLEGR